MNQFPDPKDATSGFRYVWRKLSAAGWCDAVNGVEYWRVFNEWEKAGTPTPICDFIREKANKPPEEPP